MNEFITRWLEAWTGNRPETLLAYYSDDAFYADPAKPGGLRGKEALRTYFGKLLSLNPDWVWTAEEIIPTEKGCTLKWKAQIPVNDRNITLYGLDIVEISNNQITRNEVYFDRTIWVEALKTG